jgi:hypothetical protein
VISGFFDPQVSKQLARLAIDPRRSNDDLLKEALNDLFTKYQLSDRVTCCPPSKAIFAWYGVAII